MDPSEINFTIKTGSDLTQQNELDDEKAIDIITLITTFTQNSLRSADIYVKHSNRKTITSKDIQMAMKYEVFEFTNRNNQKELSETKKEITKDYFDILENGERDDDFDYDEAVDNLIEETKEKYCKSKCNCEICEKMNYIDKAWVHWQPKTNLEKILKIHISKMVDLDF